MYINCGVQPYKFFFTVCLIQKCEGWRVVIVSSILPFGAPHIWNGDEMGMVGADDPDNRKPLCGRILFLISKQSILITYSFVPRFNPECFEFYKSLIALKSSMMS